MMSFILYLLRVKEYALKYKFNFLLDDLKNKILKIFHIV